MLVAASLVCLALPVQAPVKVRQTDLDRYLENRIQYRRAGDRTGNDLAWEKGHGQILPYILQVVPMPTNRSLAIVGFRATHLSTPSDMFHDLVELRKKDSLDIRYLRSIGGVTDYSSSPTMPRLFKSRSEWLLRVKEGFEVLGKDGQAVNTIPVPGSRVMLGQSKGVLVFGVTSASRPAVVRFELTTRKFNEALIPLPQGRVTMVDFQKDEKPGYAKASMAVNDGKDAYADFRIDIATGKVSRPVWWHVGTSGGAPG